MRKTKEIDTTEATWSYAELWDKYPIPARPDSEELDIEEKTIRGTQKNLKDLNLMILGSTIEYRSLAKKLGTTPYVVDFARGNFDSLTSYSSERFENEHFVEEDWLKIKFTNFFDFILGHRPFNVIRHDQVGELFKRMYLSLKNGGIFFCRGNVRFKEDRDRLDEIIEKWGKSKNRKYPLFSYIEVALYARCGDDEGYLNYPKARSTAKEWFEKGKISKTDYELVKPLISMPEGTKFRSFIRKEELDKFIKDAGFSNAEYLFTSHEFTKNMPIIRLIK
jgi:SAM-dependent methyltransferase